MEEMENLTERWRQLVGADEYRPVPYRFARIPADLSVEVADELRRKMQLRRSVRMFSSEPVPQRAVIDAIAAAATAPSGGHRQPWTFVLVEDPQLRGWIRKEAEREDQAPYDGDRDEDWRAAVRPLGLDPVKAYLTDAPYLIVVFRQYQSVNEAGDRRRNRYVDESVGIATGMLLTALHLSGLAALVHTPSPTRFLAEMLGRPRAESPFAVIPVGYPAKDCIVPDLTRKPLDEVLVRI